MKIKFLSLVAAVTMLTSEAFAGRNFHCQDKSNSDLKFNITVDSSNQLLSLNATSMYEGKIILTNFFDLIPCTYPSGGGYGGGTSFTAHKYFSSINSSTGSSMNCSVSFSYDYGTASGVIESKVNYGLQTHYETTCKEL